MVTSTTRSSLVTGHERFNGSVKVVIFVLRADEIWGLGVPPARFLFLCGAKLSGLTCGPPLDVDRLQVIPVSARRSSLGDHASSQTVLIKFGEQTWDFYVHFLRQLGLNTPNSRSRPVKLEMCLVIVSKVNNGVSILTRQCRGPKYLMNS